MMSNRSAFSQGRFLGYESKRYVYLLLVISILSLLLGPMINFIVLKREFSPDWMGQKITPTYIVNHVGEYFQIGGAFVPYFLAGLLGIVFALVFSSYLQTKKQANFFHALPVKRHSWLTYQYLIGFTFFTIINLLMLLGNIGLLVYLTGASAIPFSTLLLHFFQAELFFLTSYAISILAGHLVGNVLAQVAMIGTLQFGIAGFGLLIEGYMSTFFKTFIESPLAENLMKFSLPTGYLTYVTSLETNNYDSGMLYNKFVDTIPLPLPVMSIKMLISMAVVTILCIGLSYVAYHWRAMERVSETLVFRKLKFFLKLYFGLMSAAGLGLIFYSLSANSFFFLGAGVVFGLILCHFFFEMAINRDVRAMLRPRYWLSTVLILALSSGFCFIFIKDVFGYDTYVPNDDSVDNVRLEDELTGLHFAPYSEKMALKDRGNITQVIKIAQLGIKNLDKATTQDGAIPLTKEVMTTDMAMDASFSSDSSVSSMAVPPSVSEKEEEIVGIRVYYTLANGSQVSRHYSIPKDDYFKLFKSIYESKSYRDLVKEAVKTMMAEPNYDFRISNDLFESNVLHFSTDKNLPKEEKPKTTKADLEALKKAILADIDKRTLDNYGKNIVATMSGNFGLLGNSWFNVWVTREDKATVAFFKDMEAKKHNVPNQSFYLDKLPEFKEVTITKVDNDDDKGTVVKTIKDNKVIATLLREDSVTRYSSNQMVDRTYLINGKTINDEYLVTRVFLPGKASKYLAGA